MLFGFHQQDICFCTCGFSGGLGFGHFPSQSVRGLCMYLIVGSLPRSLLIVPESEGFSSRRVLAAPSFIHGSKIIVVGLKDSNAVLQVRDGGAVFDDGVPRRCDRVTR